MGLLADGALDEFTLTFDSGQHPNVLEASLTKYGKPSTSETSELTNAFGAKVQATLTQWVDGQGNQAMLYSDLDRNTVDICPYFSTESCGR